VNQSNVANPTRRFFAWKTLHPREAEDAGLVWAEAWRQAYWAGIRENAQLGLQLLELVQHLEGLEQRLHDLQASAEYDRELESHSVYWKTSHD